MWLGILILVVIAIVILFVAHLIAAGNTELLHSWHTQHVKEEERSQYAKHIANSLRVMGIGFFIAAGFAYAERAILVLTVIFVSLILGGILLSIGQRRYERR